MSKVKVWKDGTANDQPSDSDPNKILRTTPGLSSVSVEGAGANPADSRTFFDAGAREITAKREAGLVTCLWRMGEDTWNEFRGGADDAENLKFTVTDGQAITVTLTSGV